MADPPFLFPRLNHEKKAAPERSLCGLTNVMVQAGTQMGALEGKM